MLRENLIRPLEHWRFIGGDGPGFLPDRGLCGEEQERSRAQSMAMTNAARSPGHEAVTQPVTSPTSADERPTSASLISDKREVELPWGKPDDAGERGLPGVVPTVRPHAV